MQPHLSRVSRLDARLLGGLLLLLFSLVLGLVVGFTQAAAYPGPWAQEDDCPLILLAEPPPAPSDLTCIPVSETEIALCWRDNSCNESEFRVERSDDAGPWHEVGSVPKNANTYRDSGLTPGSTYRYRVRGYRQSDGEYSGYTSETTCIAALPGRVGPADRECENPLTFEWTPVSGAITYTLQVGTTPTLDPPLTLTEEVTGTSYTPADALPLGTYYWRVRAQNECAASAWSTTWSVVLIVAPGPPDPLSPPDGQTTCDVQPTFCWSQVSDATSYSLIIDDDLDLRSPVVDVTDLTDTCFTLTEPLLPGRYYWSADAANECGRAWSPPRVLIIEGPPDAPDLDSPPDGEQTCEASPTFSWTPPADADSCCFQLDDNPDFSSPIIAECEATPPYTVTASLEPGTYYWRVKCRNQCGYGDWSPARSFVVLQPPSPPTLEQPDDGLETCDDTPAFSWSQVQGAPCYSFELADNPDFSTPIISESCLLTTTYTITSPLAPGDYYWRADASNECGPNWSDTRQLTILPTPDEPPILVSPPDQASTCDDPPSFCWTLIAGATSYDLEIDDQVYAGQEGPCFLPSGPLGLGEHTWRVRANNVCGPGPWSPTRSITIEEYESTCEDLVCNGGFETDECWIDPPACAPRYSTYKVHSGSTSMLIGVPTWAPDTRCTSAVWQPVTIPADATSAVLSFWYWPWSQDTITYDWQEVQVRDAGFEVLETLMLVNETSSGDDPWRQRTFDLLHYAGQTIYIYFAVHNDGVGDLRTFMYLDDVTLVVCQTRWCAAPSTAIAGRITLQGRTEHGGVAVHVDDTHCYVTDEDGIFLCDVTPGTHTVSASLCKYLTAETVVNAPSGTTVNLPDLFLLGGDVNNDCAVDIFDVVTLGAAYDTCPGDDLCSSVDTNGDGCVDIRDLVIVGGNYGLDCPTPWSGIETMEMAVVAPSAPVKVRLTRTEQRGGGMRYQVWLEDVKGLYAADVRLRFDPGVIQVVDSDRSLDGVQIQTGPRLHDVGTFVARAEADNAAGAIHLAFTRLAPTSPLHGDVLLTTVDLRGTGELNLTDVQLLDPEGRALEWLAPEADRLPFRLYLPLMPQPGG